MGNLLKTNKDFYWTPSDEPHAIRRKLILGKNYITLYYSGNLKLLF
jgi:hypothetical protein